MLETCFVNSQNIAFAIAATIGLNRRSYPTLNSFPVSDKRHDPDSHIPPLFLYIV